MAELTLESVNKGRVAMGLEPLAKLATDTTDTISAGASNSAADVAIPDTKDSTEDNAPKDPEFTDDQILAFLNKKGITATSIDDLKKKEEAPAAKTAEQLAEERESNKLRFALEKGIFSTKEHEGFITESKNKEGVVFADYVTEARAEDPTVSDEELEQEFSEKFGLGADKDSRKFKRGQKEIELLADKILKTRYNKIYEADNAFSQFEESQKEQARELALIKEKSPAYQKDVNEVFEGLKKLTVKFSDTESYEADVVQDSIDKAKATFLSPDFVKKYVQEGWSKQEIHDVAFTAILRANYIGLVDKVSTDRMRNNQAGAKGIPVGGVAKKEDTINPNIEKLSDRQKVAREQFYPQAAN